MSAYPFATTGDGKLHRLNEKGTFSSMNNDRQVYSITFICGKTDITGVTSYTTGVAVGVDNELAVFLQAGDTVTFTTYDLGAVCWNDYTNVSYLTIQFELPVTYTLKGD
jgi:hypothetical protein